MVQDVINQSSNFHWSDPEQREQLTYLSLSYLVLQPSIDQSDVHKLLVADPQRTRKCGVLTGAR